MLRATIDVNGKKIGSIIIVQIGSFAGDYREYRYTVTRWSDDDLGGIATASAKVGRVRHHRTDSPMELIRLVLNDIRKDEP